MSFPSARTSAPIQVDGHVSTAQIVALVLGVIGVLLGLVMVFFDRWIAALILMGSLAVFVISLVVIVLRRRRRAWVELYPDGFAYRDRFGESRYDDEEVIGVQLTTKKNFRQGQLKSYTNTVEFKIADRKQPLKLIHTTTLDQVDPLSGFLDRTLENYRQRAESALHAGARLGGAGWSLGRDDLDVTGTDTMRIPLRDLVAIDTVDDHYKLWRKGIDEAVLSIPVKSENAFLLSTLLTPRITERQQEEVDFSRPGLGREIFRRATGRWGRWFGKACMATVILIAVIPIVIFCLFGPAPLLIGIGLAVLLVSPPVLVLGLFLLRNEFRCHERGVYRRLLGKPRELRFEDVDVFTYKAIRQYYNGAYVGTSLALAFVPTASSGKKKIGYSRMVQNVDDALESLREHVARIVMQKLAMELSQTGAVQWLPHVRITHEGLHYRAKGFVSRQKEQLLPFAEVTGFEIDDGTFRVWQRGADKSVINEATTEPNFFPGYLLLSAMYWSAGDWQADGGDVLTV
jgi:hypothetical protein